MDIPKLVEVLRATLQPDQREQAEQQLNEVLIVKHVICVLVKMAAHRTEFAVTAVEIQSPAWSCLVKYCLDN